METINEIKQDARETLLNETKLSNSFNFVVILIDKSCGCWHERAGFLVEDEAEAFKKTLQGKKRVGDRIVEIIELN